MMTYFQFSIHILEVTFLLLFAPFPDEAKFSLRAQQEEPGPEITLGPPSFKLSVFKQL